MRPLVQVLAVLQLALTWFSDVATLDRPLMLKEAGLYNCLLFNSSSQGLVCDIVGVDAADAIRRLPTLPWSISSLSLVIQRTDEKAETDFLLPVDSLSRHGQLEFLLARNRRSRQMILAECALEPLAGSLRSLSLHGFSGVLGSALNSGDPFCMAEMNLTSLSLNLDYNGCDSYSMFLNRTALSLKQLRLSQPSDCYLNRFKLDSLPLLESVQLRTTSNSADEAEDGGGSRGQPRFHEENLSGFQFRNLPNLRQLTLMLHQKIVKCHNGSVFGAGSFVNLTRLESFSFGDMFVMNPMEGRCELLAPGAFQAGSGALQLVSVNAIFMSPMGIDLRNNAELLECRNCSQQKLVIGETVWFPSSIFSNPSQCRLLLPIDSRMTVTDLRIAKFHIGEINASFLSQWPRLRTLIVESTETELNKGDNDGGFDRARTNVFGNKKQPLVTKLYLEDFTDYVRNNSELDHVTIYARECTCSVNSSDYSKSLTPSAPATRLRFFSIGCGNIDSEPFTSLESAKRACYELANFQDQLEQFLQTLGGQCIHSSPRVLSCLLTNRDFFKRSAQIPFMLNQLDCMIKTYVPLLRRRLLANAPNLRILVLAGYRYSRRQRQGLYEIQDGAFQALRNLETLVLRNNHLSHIGESTFSGLTKLRYLDLSCNFNLLSIDARALYPTAASLQFLRLTIAEPTQLPKLISQSGLTSLETLNIEVSTRPEILSQPGAEKWPQLVDLPEGSIANLTTLRELAVSFDDDGVPLRVRLQTGSLANLPVLQSLSMQLNHHLSTMSIEPGAFQRLAGTQGALGLKYLSLRLLQAPVSDSDWLELLSGPVTLNQEAILNFAQLPDGNLFGNFTAMRQGFNTSRLTLSLRQGCYELNQQELSYIGHLFPKLRWLTLKALFTINLANHRILNQLRASASYLTRLDAVLSNCSSPAELTWPQLLPELNSSDSGSSAPRLLLRLSCLSTPRLCGFQLEPNAGRQLSPMTTILLLGYAIVPLLALGS